MDEVLIEWSVATKQSPSPSAIYTVLDPLDARSPLLYRFLIESEREGMKLGAYDYLTKSCEPDDLLARVEWAKKHCLGARSQNR